MVPYKHYGLLAVVSLMWMAGCSSPYVENNKIEEIAPVVFWSVDKGTEGKLRISTLVPRSSKKKTSSLQGSRSVKAGRPEV